MISFSRSQFQLQINGARRFQRNSDRKVDSVHAIVALHSDNL